MPLRPTRRIRALLGFYALIELSLLGVLLPGLLPRPAGLAIHLGLLLVIAVRTARISVETTPNAVHIKNRYRTYTIDAHDIVDSRLSPIGGNGPQAIQLLTRQPQWFGRRPRVTVEASAAFDADRLNDATHQLRNFRAKAKRMPRDYAT